MTQSAKIPQKKSRLRPKLICPQPGTEGAKTKQAFKEDCDMNIIMKRLDSGALQLKDLIRAEPTYGDFADMPTYQESLNVVIKANEQFEALPSEVRDRFANDPAKFLQFATDPSNAREMVDLGLATLRETPRAAHKAASEGLPPRQPSRSPSRAGQAPSAGTEPAAPKNDDDT